MRPGEKKPDDRILHFPRSGAVECRINNSG